MLLIDFTLVIEFIFLHTFQHGENLLLMDLLGINYADISKQLTEKHQ